MGQINPCRPRGEIAGQTLHTSRHHSKKTPVVVAYQAVSGRGGVPSREERYLMKTARKLTSGDVHGMLLYCRETA